MAAPTAEHADRSPPAPRVHVVARAGRHPGCVIVVPGGSYAGLSPSEAEPVCAWLAENDRAALWLEYDVAPARHPRSLVQLLRTISAARRGMWTAEGGPVTVLGFSAGGHLAGLSATVLDEEVLLLPEDERGGCRPDLVAMAYPVTDLTEPTMAGIAHNLLGERPSRAARWNVSLESRLRSGCPPLFLWHTLEDASVPVQASLRLAIKAADQGVSAETHIFPYGPHGLGVSADRAPLVDAWRGLLIEWMEHHGA